MARSFPLAAHSLRKIRSMRKFVPILFLLSLSCMPGGCQQKVAEKVVEKAVESQTGAKVDIEAGGGVKVEGELKEVTYPGAKVDVTYEAEGKRAVVMKTKDDPQKVMDYYVKKFGPPALKAQQEDGIFLSWDNGMTVMISREGGWTTVAVAEGGM